MSAIFLGIVITVLILLGVFVLVREVFKNIELFKGAWRRMESFERISLQVSSIYYVAFELLKKHPAKDNFISSALSNIMSALIEALFIIGVIAFLKHAHDLNRRDLGKHRFRRSRVSVRQVKSRIGNSRFHGNDRFLKVR